VLIERRRTTFFANIRSLRYPWEKPRHSASRSPSPKKTLSPIKSSPSPKRAISIRGSPVAIRSPPRSNSPSPYRASPSRVTSSPPRSPPRAAPSNSISPYRSPGEGKIPH
jgi:hypothetical protein